jgi:hypothetical protein
MAGDDIAFVDGDFVSVDGIEAIAQEIKIAIRNFKDDWFLDLDDGIDYFGDVFKKHPDIAVIDTTLKDTILGIDRVVKFTKYDLKIDNATRELKFDFEVLTDLGLLSFSDILPSV